MRIIFAGTPDISAQVLKDLLETQKDNKNFEVIATLTQPDRPKGRGRVLSASPVKELSIEHKIPVYQPENLKNQEIIDILNNLNPDLILVIAYGLIVPQNILDLPKHGCWNIHVSLLPKWRGAAPIQRAIEAGDDKTGVTIMQMDKGLDTGDILLQKTCNIEQDDTSESLYKKLAKLSAPAALETLDKLQNNNLNSVSQDDNQKTIAPKLSKEEANINWNTPAKIINQKIRAFNPWPVAQTSIDSIVIRIYNSEVIDNINNKDFLSGQIIEFNKDNGLLIKCLDSQLKVTHVQLPGKGVLEVCELVNSPKYQELFAPKKVFD